MGRDDYERIDMKHKIAIGVGVVSTFALGFKAGHDAHMVVMQARMEQFVPLMVNAFASVLVRAAEEHLTADEINELLGEELEFLKIVVP